MKNFHLNILKYIILLQILFLSYDLVGLVYYLILQNNSKKDEKIFQKKKLFKGKVGIFEIKNNKINHILNFYKRKMEVLKKSFNFFKSFESVIYFIFIKRFHLTKSYCFSKWYKYRVITKTIFTFYNW